MKLMQKHRWGDVGNDRYSKSFIYSNEEYDVTGTVKEVLVKFQGNYVSYNRDDTHKILS